MGRKEILKTRAVLETKIYKLAGCDQKVLFEGKNADDPIIIFLHGGPGSPLPFCAGARGLFPQISDRFIMVYWDQYGCGMNDGEVDDTFTIDRFVDMTVDLICAVKRDFPKNPVHLFAVSWGSILAAKAAARIPEQICRVLVYGQIIKDLFFNEEVFSVLESSPLSAKARKQLALIKSKPVKTTAELKLAAKLIRKYTEGYQAKNGGKMPIGKMIWGILTSPDYSLRNFRAVVMNSVMKSDSLYQELLALDLSETLEKITLPYLMIQGDKDIVTSTRFVQNFMKRTNNKNLRLNIVSDSGHMPGAKGMEYTLRAGLDFLEGKEPER